MPMQFNMLHVLPQSKIPVERLPLDVMVANYLSLEKKKEGENGNKQYANLTHASQGGARNNREEMEATAKDMGLFMLPELTFDHCFYPLSYEQLRSGVPAIMMKEIYQRASDLMRLSERPDQGITLIMTGRWFFLALLTQPYGTCKQEVPVYLDGFDFCGLVSLQTMEKAWPATAGLEDNTISVLEAYAKSTKVTKIMADEEEGQAAGVDVAQLVL